MVIQPPSAALINSKLMTRIASTIQLTGWANCVVTTISKAPVTRRIKRLSNIMISCHLLEELYTSHLLSTRNRLIEQNGKRKRLRKDLRACPCQGPLIYHRCPQLFYWIFEFWRLYCCQQPLRYHLKHDCWKEMVCSRKSFQVFWLVSLWNDDTKKAADCSVQQPSVTSSIVVTLFRSCCLFQCV